MKHIQSQITDKMRVLLSPAAEPHPSWRGCGQNSPRHPGLPRSWLLVWQLLARLSLLGGWPETFSSQGIRGRFREGKEC